MDGPTLLSFINWRQDIEFFFLYFEYYRTLPYDMSHVNGWAHVADVMGWLGEVAFAIEFRMTRRVQ